MTRIKSRTAHQARHLAVRRANNGRTPTLLPGFEQFFRIVYPYEGQALRGSAGTRRLAVTRRKRPGNPPRITLASPHLNEGPRDRAHHRVEEGVSHYVYTGNSLTALILLMNPETHDTAMRGLALGGRRLAEALEIMLSDKGLSGLIHRIRVKRAAQPPGMIPRENRSSLASDNAIAVATRAGVKACRETRGGTIKLRGRDVIREQGGEAMGQAPCVKPKLRGAQGHAHILGESMDARIRTARAS